MLTKMKKSSLKFKNSKFEKRKKKSSGDVVDSCLSTKFGINSFDGFWENALYGRTTMPDAFRHGKSSAGTVKQS